MIALPSLPRWAWFAIGGVLLLLALYLALDAYGDSRYRKGVSDTDAKWVEASAKLKAEAAKSATKADDRAAARLEEHVAQATEDQEKVNEAVRNGSSPLDALFGG